MRITTLSIVLYISLYSFASCYEEKKEKSLSNQNVQHLHIVEQPIRPISPEKITLEKELLYDNHTLDDNYTYRDKARSFQWDKIKERLAKVETIQKETTTWAVLQNYKNRNGEAALVKKYVRNAYQRVADTLGVEKYQSVPLIIPGDSIPEIYSRDGSLVRYIKDTADYIKVETVSIEGEWLVPKKYVKVLGDTLTFDKTVFVDVTNQNIATVEKGDSKWYIRSMNPATTGVHRPPYAQETPVGMYVIQEKKSKMFFLVDGSHTDIAGYAPYASRFTNGAYIHGVPVNLPRTEIIEYSTTLGTTPRSHMCVRNASSHAKFIFDWTKTGNTLVFILD